MSQDIKIETLKRDWFSNMRSQDTFVHKNVEHALTHLKRKNESYSEYAFGKIFEGKDCINQIKTARELAQMICNTISPSRTKVQLGGKESFTNGKTINIASDYFLDTKLTPGQKADILIGLTIHEAAHIAYTDIEKNSNWIQSRPKNEQRLSKNIMNILEDERIEMLVGEEKPGYADYLGEVKKKYFDREFQPKPSQERLVRFMNTLIKIIRFPAGISDELIEEEYDNLVAIKKALPSIPKTPQDTIEATRKIVEVMKNIIKEENENKQQQQTENKSNSESESQESNGQNSSEENQSQDNNASDASSETSNGSSNDSSSSSSNGSSNGSSDMASDSSSSSTGNDSSGNTGSKNEQQEQKTESFEDAINSNEMDKLLSSLEAINNQNEEDNSICNSFGNNETDYINGNAEKTNSGSNKYFIKKPEGNKVIYNDALNQVKKYIPALRKSVSCRSQESEYCMEDQKSGRLNADKLSKLRTGSTNIFTRKGEITTDGICICVLIDESGSMAWYNRSEKARETSILITEAVKKLNKVEAFVYGYTTGVLNIYQERNLCDNYALGSIHSDSGTPTGDAMKIAAERVRKYTTTPCLMLVITDGLPDNEMDVINQDNLLRKQNFIPVGIGIGSAAKISGQYKDSIILENIATLPLELSRITQKYMSKLLIKNESF